jgi:hypothetical protein
MVKSSVPKEPKAPKVPKEPKTSKEPKPSKESKASKTPRSSKKAASVTEAVVPVIASNVVENVIIEQTSPQPTQPIKKTRARKKKPDDIKSAPEADINTDANIDTNANVIELKIDSIEGIESFTLDNTSNLSTFINDCNDINDDISKPDTNSIIAEIDNLNNDNEEEKEEVSTPVKQPGKKRGRKPKGGKIIQQITATNNNKENKPNVILHLKCSIKDLDPSSSISNSQIESFHFSSNKNELSFELLNNTRQISASNNSTNISQLSAPLSSSFFQTDDLKNGFDDNLFDSVQGSNINNFDDGYLYDKEDTDECDTKDIWKKLKNLEHNLHINNISDKKSACFWCTYEFDNPPVYIPKHHIKDSYQVYGCFCSPECAVAHLMEESIDSSTKFERYQLVNHIYAKIYNYEKNIKPAPNPYYMLSRFYGNLSIQEYRSLLRNERLFLIVDKPLTRVLPELHEDNDDFILNNKIIPSNNYQIKKKKIPKKVQTKNNIVNEKFGMQPAT